MDHAYRSSLLRRLTTIHDLYGEAVATMDLDQVNYVERAGVLPIAFSLVHQVIIEDASRAFAGGPAALFDSTWSSRMGLALSTDGKAETVEVMTNQRIGDYLAFRDFQRQVFTLTESFIAEIDPDRFEDLIVRPPYPATIASTFSARLGGSVGITRSDAIESWIVQHALRHLGEIEHARALVGLGGMTS